MLHVRGTTKTVAQRKLKEIIRDYEDGLAIAPHNYTVADAVRDWLSYGLSGRSRATVEKCTILANTHIIRRLVPGSCETSRRMTLTSG